MDSRLKTILANCLKLAPEDVRPEVSRDDCKAWTSLAHLLLITQIESVFGIQLATAQVVAIRTLGDLEKVVGQAAAGGGDAGAASTWGRGAADPETRAQPALGAPRAVRRQAGVKMAALVTGSSRGIGAATARSLARRGLSVVVHYHSQEMPARQVQEDLIKEGVDVLLVQADLSSEPDLAKLRDAVAGRFGRLDVLVNNAAPPIFPAPLESLSREELANQLNAHVVAPLRISQTFFPLLKDAKSASIVNVLSIFIYGVPPQGLGAYVAAKSALAGLTRSMAGEWAKYNIRVNSVTPTITRTALSRGMPPEMLDDYIRRTPLGRLLEPPEVGETIAQVACEPTEYMTGAEIVLDGGLRMK